MSSQLKKPKTGKRRKTRGRFQIFRHSLSSLHTLTLLCRHTRIHSYMHPYILLYLCTHTHIHSCTHSRTYSLYMCTHTHIHSCKGHKQTHIHTKILTEMLPLSQRLIQSVTLKRSLRHDSSSTHLE